MGDIKLSISIKEEKSGINTNIEPNVKPIMQ